MSLGYISLAAFRVFNIFIQNGYIHPDEFFQTTEIITGKFDKRNLVIFYI